ncbi:MAG: hypothetical protein PUI95_11780, partial [Eubacteriales bacterium]|nr:hypothetical protein [Eubacteriales bacterium]
ALGINLGDALFQYLVAVFVPDGNPYLAHGNASRLSAEFDFPDTYYNAFYSLLQYRAVYRCNLSKSIL